MVNSNKRTKHVNRQSVMGMAFCISGLGLLLWSIVSRFFGASVEPMLLTVALPVLLGLGLTVAGFGLMVAGAEPFEDDSEVRDGEDLK